MLNQEENAQKFETETVFIEDPALGKLTFNRSKSWFEGEADWLGNKCSICLLNDEDDKYSIKNALDIFWKLYGNLSEWDRKFKDYAAENLTEIANEWSADLEDVPQKITKEMLAERMKVNELIVWYDGDITLYYNAGNTFYGKEIAIDANIDGRMKEIYVVG